MNGYDQQLKELLAQCARKRKLEASAAELRRQRDTYAARAEELKEAMREEQADVDRLEGRSLAAFFYNVVGKMDEKLTRERQEAYAARVRYDAAARELAGAEEDLARCQAELGTLDGCEERYAALLREKTQAVKAAGGAAAEQILRLLREPGAGAGGGVRRRTERPGDGRWDPGEPEQRGGLGHLGPDRRWAHRRPGQAQQAG